MHQRSIIMIIILFALIVIGMFIFAYLKNSELKEVEKSEPLPTAEEPAGPYDHIERVDAKHFFLDGVHTLAGEIIMPTPCDLLEAGVMIAESFPEQVTINFSVINTAEACAQVLTPQRFKVEATASSAATFSARLQGRSVELNLIPAAEGETPDEFEVFIKG